MCFYSYKHLWCLVSNIIFHENIHTTKQHCFSCLRPSYVNKNLENHHHNWSKEKFWGALLKTFVTFVYIQNFTPKWSISLVQTSHWLWSKCMWTLWMTNYLYFFDLEWKTGKSSRDFTWNHKNYGRPGCELNFTI